MGDPTIEVSERERWETEQGFRKREIELREEEIRISRQEVSSRWRNPLVLAILAAAIAAAGNAIVAVVNGNLQRDLEDTKAEQARILEVIKVGANPDKAAENLSFLLKAGLIRNPEQVRTLGKFLAERKPGTGPALPSPDYNSRSGSEPANKEASEQAATRILSLLAQKKYSEVWDQETSDWFKQSVSKDKFLANMTLGRAPIGELLESRVISADFADTDPSTGYKGIIYAISFANTYSSGKFFERIVVIKEKDGRFRLSGIWGDLAEKQ